MDGLLKKTFRIDSSIRTLMLNLPPFVCVFIVIDPADPPSSPVSKYTEIFSWRGF